ncbi:Toxin-antitoxin system protein [Ruminococcaceae bacterium BL-6]|nr:Toxin-antitoxin system protein [Ruminococcaceae bacterium BL-6]CAB1247972.1 Toxin-antitoxin system protein [Ruminococcaceae bacterium BL-6]
MPDEKEIRVKTIRIESDIADKIQKLANESERDFSSQVRFMLKEYLRIKEQ